MIKNVPSNQGERPQEWRTCKGRERAGHPQEGTAWLGWQGTFALAFSFLSQPRQGNSFPFSSGREAHRPLDIREPLTQSSIALAHAHVQLPTPDSVPPPAGGT
jgi:hypothetical protein